MLKRIQNELNTDPFYRQHFANDGQRFVAWYLRRVLLRSQSETKQEIPDGAGDKQIDAVIVDDDTRRIVIIQGKFITSQKVDSEPLREVLSAWMRLKDLETLQRDCNNKLRERLEAVKQGLEDDYDLHLELLTTGVLTDSAQKDLEVFSDQLASAEDFPAHVTLVDNDVLQTRLLEAESKELPILNHEIALDSTHTLIMELNGTRSIISAVSLRECLKIKGITDGRLFRKNVRQALGTGNKVNKGLRNTILGERHADFFFYHNGITALCKKFTINEERTKLYLEDLSVVNGCQSLTAIYSASQRIRSLADNGAYILFRFYEIPQRDLADRISIFTNSQSAVKPRDLRSNDRIMLAIKKAYESVYTDGLFLAQRGGHTPGNKDVEKIIDCADFAKAIMAWHCQRPNIAYNEKKLFDEYYKTIFHADYNPASIFAIKKWMLAIEKAWDNLALNDVLKAGKSYVRHHLLFSISSLIAYASNQGDKVPNPSATLNVSANHVADILPLAVNCLNKALESAITQANTSGKVFSPQNWSKTNASVQGEALVASTIIGMLPGIGAQQIIDKLRIPAEEFGLRWAAE